MRFLTLGNASNIGASCHYLDLDSCGLVLDAGADPNLEGPDSLPSFKRLGNRAVSHGIITHAHHDHIGAIPALVEAYPHVALHMTEPTRQLTSFMLEASVRLQRRRFAEGTSPYSPLFEYEDLDAVQDAVRTHAYAEWFDLMAGDLAARFYYSGHLLGATGVLLTTGSGMRVFYTSDTNMRPQTIVPGGHYPKEAVDVLIMECTLAADAEAERVTRKSEEQRLVHRIRKVLKRGGTVLLPVFMLGRAQEVLCMLGRFRQRGQLDPEIPIYTAGGLRQVSAIYDATRFDTPRLDPDFEVYSVEQRRFPRGKKAKRRSLREPSIHVLSSGMMVENTMSNWVAQEIIEHEKHAIFLVGFAKEDLPAGQLLQAVVTGADEVILDPRAGAQTIACEVDRFRFSGHSHRRDLVELVQRLSPRTVILVHGETEARAWMSDEIVRSCRSVDVLSPGLGEEVDC